MRRTVFAASLLLAILALALFAGNLNVPAFATPLQASPTPGIEIEPVDPTPTPSVPPRTPPPGGGTVGGTPVAPPRIKPPATLDDLLKQYPDLQPYLDKVKDLNVGDMDMAELYSYIVRIFETNGASGVAAFLKDTGILDKLNIPLSYLDLLTAFDEGGLEAVDELARDRQLININNEVVAFLSLDDKANLDAVTKALQALGVTVYDYSDDLEELEIGIPLEILAQYGTPGTLLDYLVKVATVEHVIGVRAPTPRVTTGRPSQQEVGQAARTIGADKWQEKGFTGKGIKIGVLDVGFGGIKALLGKTLPETVQSEFDIDELDEQEEDHGTAVAQVIHSIAPEAELYVTSSGTGAQSFIDSLKWFEENKVQVINHSASYLIGPRDGTSFSSQIVSAFVKDTGILWVNSAGNYALSHARFKFEEGEGKAHFFDEETNLMPFVAYSSQSYLALNWDGNWNGGEKTEYIVTIFDRDGNEVASGAEPRRGKKNQFPFQEVQFESERGEVYFMLFQRTRGTTDNVLDVILPFGELADWAQEPLYSVTTPADAEGALSVAATGLDADDLEEYSSQGPTQDDRQKPDIAAPTGEFVTGYEERGFSGTSGAAPVVAGAAGLVLQAFPDLSEPELKAYLTKNVVDLGEPGLDVQFGAGRLALPDPANLDTDNPNPGDDDNKTTDAPKVTISKVNTKFNVKLSGKRGVAIYVTFEVDGYKGKELVVAATFTDTDDNPIPSEDENYSIRGGLATATGFKVKANQTVFKDVPLFIPNTVFTSVPEDITEMLMTVIVLDTTDRENPARLSVSDPIKIKLKR